MPIVGLGVNEIRVRLGGAYRVIYVAKFLEAVYVLHAFQKKSRKTARTDIDLAKRRFGALIQDRRQQWPKS
jgi:phage-related protein